MPGCKRPRLGCNFTLQVAAPMTVGLGRLFSLTLVVCWCAPAAYLGAPELRAADTTDRPKDDAEGLQFFEQKIRPVLVEQCYECHSAGSKNLKGGLYLDSRDGLLKGGDSGPSIEPGKAANSLLLQALKYDGLEMPPKGRLPAEVIANFEKWISMGAPD